MPRARLHWRLGDEERRTYQRGRELGLAELDRLEPGPSVDRIGSSVFPNSGATGPTSKIAGLALRLKDRLVRQLQSAAPTEIRTSA